jgi:hypothetical protein
MITLRLVVVPVVVRVIGMEYGRNNNIRATSFVDFVPL